MSAGDSQGREQASNSIIEFAAELRELRVEAGNPSFRQMAGASGSISHTTLHEAAAGSRFPSWETTREFVKACGGDETEWRARWERARDAIEPRQTSAAQPSGPVGPDSGTKRSMRRRLLVTAGAALVVVGASFIGLVTIRPAEPSSSNIPPSPPSGPVIPGDRSRFITDVTIPDGTIVRPNQTFEKVWEIQNAGTVMWRNRYLRREDLPVTPGKCRTPDRIPVGDTLPNERIKISVTVTAPSVPGTCMVKWKMVDAQGRYLFPTSRPIYFLVHVEGRAGTPEPK
jgi:hypothetical protein